MKVEPIAECSQCGKPFVRRNTMARVCSPRCAIKSVKVKRKAEKAQFKARQEAAKPRSQWLKEAQAAFNAYIRARDREQPCICCGSWGNDDMLTGGGWDAGHYRSTGSAPHLRFNEDNCHRQTKHCNRYRGGRAVDYRLGLIQRIGIERVEALEADQMPRKYTVDDLREIRDKYRSLVKAQTL